MWPDRALPALTGLAVAVGAVLRVRQWWHGRAYWVDELQLLQAIDRQRFAELLHPLQHDQAAPPGWLAAQHVLIGLTGGDERGARLLPLLLGVGTVVLTAVLARLLLGGPAALAATVLVAVSPPLVRYSSELKQYSGDGFWVLLVVLAGCRVALDPAGRARPGVSAGAVRPGRVAGAGRPRLVAGAVRPGRVAGAGRPRVVLGVVAAAAVWCSHAGALATGGVLLAVGLRALARRRWRELAGLVAAGLPAAAGLAVQYVTLLSADTGNAVLRRYWAATFPPDGSLTAGVAGDWLAGRVRAVAADPLGWPVRAWVLVLVVAGLAALAARRPAAVAVPLLAVGAVAAAGLAGAYPVGGRLALFAVAPAALVAAAALDLPAAVARVRGPRPPVLAAAGLVALAATGGLVVLAAPAVSRSAALLARPYEQEEIRTVLAAVAADRRAGDLVLVDGYGGRFAAGFYGPRVGLGPYGLLRVDRGAGRCGVLAGAARVWVVTVHTRPADAADYRTALGRLGPPSRTVTEVGAEATRYDRAPGPPAPPGSTWAGAGPAVSAQVGAGRCVRMDRP